MEGNTMKSIHTKLYLALGTLAALGTLYGIKSICVPAQEPEVTDIALFIDSPTQKASNKAIPHEFIKAIDAGCSHIFLNPTLFKTAISYVVPEDFIQMWDVYDTGIGLVYLHNKEDTQTNIGIATHKFSKLANVQEAALATLSKESRWVPSFIELFDVAAWQNYHTASHRSVMLYMNGHGLPRSPEQVFNMCCSLSTPDFATLFKTMLEQLKVDVFVIQSCYWTAQRVLDLMDELHGMKTLPCTVISPLEKERALHLDGLGNYLQGETPCFFDGCREATYELDGSLDKEVTKYITNTDTILLDKNQGQRPTIVVAGATAAVAIA
jgi:hypothetical protein